MSDTHPDYNGIVKNVDIMPHGKARIDAYQKCIELADKHKDRDRQIKYRLLLMDESCHHDDTLQAYLVFPVLLKISDEAFAETGDRPYLYKTLWQYKWLIEDARFFYQIDQEQFEKLVQDAIVRFQNAGYNARSIYMQAAQFYVYSDPAKAEEYYRQYLATPRDDMSDCSACESNSEFLYLLSKGRYLIAMHKAQAIFEGRRRCAEVPFITYTHYMLFMARRKLSGEQVSEDVMAMMKDYASKCRRIMVSENKILEEVGKLLMYYAVFDPSKSLGFIQRFPDFTEAHRYNPFAVFYFALGMMLFIKGIGDKETYKMKMDPRFRFYNPDNTYNVAEMYEFYRVQAEKTANGFIESQKNDSFRKLYDLVISQEVPVTQ